MKMEKTKKLSVSSNDSNDDTNSFKSLCKHSNEKCLFCDKHFKNRYNVLVHTASHIIIPLLKQDLHQCPECLFHFTSLDDLNYHTYQKHTSFSGMQDYSFDDHEINDILEDQKSRISHKIIPDLTSFVNSEPVVKCEELGFPPVNNFIKSLIVFEDDNEVKTTERKQLPNTDNKCSADDAKYKSVHYDILTQPGQYKCKMCELEFQSRYDLIIHETDHVMLKRNKLNLCRVCERYIAGNYRTMNAHLLAKHNGVKKRLNNLSKCRKCHLNYYNYYRHIRNYHEIYKCSQCGKGFEVESERDQHKLECTSSHWDHTTKRWDSKMKKVCEMCYTFFKTKKNFQFVKMGDFNEVGSRHRCERCGEKYFELKIVKFWFLSRNVGEVKKTAPLSNEDRLSKIQKRLKMLKMM